MIERQIKRGQKFLADSKKSNAVWMVTRRIKTDDKNVVYTKVINGKEQSRKYTGHQFGYLLRNQIIVLI